MNIFRNIKFFLSPSLSNTEFYSLEKIIRESGGEIVKSMSDDVVEISDKWEIATIIESPKKKLVGSKFVRYCYENYKPLIVENLPLLSNDFENFVISTAGVAEKITKQIELITKCLGGKYVHNYEEGITHLIVENNRLPIVIQARAKGNIHIVNYNWIFQSFRSNSLAQPELFPVLPLRGVKASTSGFQDKKIRERIFSMLTKLGALYFGSFSEAICTHLIIDPINVNIGKEGKYAHAKLWEKHVVGIEWLEECARSFSWVDESNYELTISEEKDKIMTTEIIENGILNGLKFYIHGISNIKNRIESFVVSHSGIVLSKDEFKIMINEHQTNVKKHPMTYIIAPHGTDKYLSVKYPFPIVSIQWIEFCVSEKKLIDPQSYPHLFTPMPFIPHTYSEFMGKCNISISGFDAYESKLLEVISKILGATFYQSLKPKKTTHLICNHASGKKYEKAISAGIHTVTKFWLFKCIEEGRLINESSYKVYNSTIIKPESPRDIKAIENSDFICVNNTTNLQEKIPIFKDVVVCINKKLSKMQPDLEAMVTNLGGHCSWSCDETVTHYIYIGKHENSKEFKMVKNIGIFIVHPLWIHKSFQENKRFPEDMFPSNLDVRMSLGFIVADEFPTREKKDRSSHKKKIQYKPKINKDNETTFFPMDVEDEKVPPPNTTNIEFNSTSHDSDNKLVSIKEDPDVSNNNINCTIEQEVEQKDINSDDKLKEIERAQLLKEILSMAPALLSNKSVPNSNDENSTSEKNSKEKIILKRRITRSELSFDNLEERQAAPESSQIDTINIPFESSQSEDALLLTSINLKKDTFNSPSKSVVYKGNEMDNLEKLKLLKDIERNKDGSPSDDKLFYDELDQFNQILVNSGKNFKLNPNDEDKKRASNTNEGIHYNDLMYTLSPKTSHKSIRLSNNKMRKTYDLT